MASLTYPLDPDAIRRPVLVTWPSILMRAAAASGLPVPAPVRAFAVIDTAAVPTAIAADVAQQLGLPVAGTATTITAAGPLQVRLFRIGTLLTPHAGHLPPVALADDLLVSELPYQPAGVDVLLGLDVLLGCRLLIDGPARTFTLDV